MHHHRPPLHQAEQQFALLIASEGGMHAAAAPPAHHCQARRTQGSDDGSRGRVVVARLDVAQALGFAGTHGTEVLRGLAFWFLPFDSHPRWPAPLRLAHASYAPARLSRCHNSSSTTCARHLGACNRLLRRLLPGFRLLRAQQIAASFAKAQAAHAIAIGQDHLDRLQEDAYQAFVQQAIQRDEQREQKHRQFLGQPLCHLLSSIGWHLRHFWRYEILTLHKEHLLRSLERFSLLQVSLKRSLLARSPSLVKFGMTHGRREPALYRYASFGVYRA